MNDKKALNNYCGLGGNRKKWPPHIKVTAVDNDPKILEVYARQHPNDECILGDAHQYLIEHYDEFDFIWSSPPCQTHSKMMKFTRHDVRKYPDMKLHQEIIWLQEWFEGSWVVENVDPYYQGMQPGRLIGRHMVWSNLDLSRIQDVKTPKGFINKSNLAAKQEMMDWLDIHYEENIYYGTNHCPVQILRNCVHPDLGLAILNEFLGIKPPEQQFALGF